MPVLVPDPDLVVVVVAVEVKVVVVVVVEVVVVVVALAFGVVFTRVTAEAVGSLSDSNSLFAD